LAIDRANTTPNNLSKGPSLCSKFDNRRGARIDLAAAAVNRAALFRTAAVALAPFRALSAAPVARAHETITVGNCTVEYGWVNEPPVAGLKVQAEFGGQTKVLTLKPLGESTPGQSIALLTPTRPGTYTIHLDGWIGSIPFDTDVVPEEVHTTDLLQFPVVAATQSSTSPGGAMGSVGWLGLAGSILGAIGLVLGVIAISCRPAVHGHSDLRAR
jgi:hypothetical protein